MENEYQGVGSAFKVLEQHIKNGLHLNNEPPVYKKG